jgi:circadian clock protein KaiC
MAKAKKIEKLWNTKPPDALDKAETGIEGFEDISFGGLPRGRSTLVSGTSGSGKTIFSCQFLAEGIRKYGEHGVFVTFEEQVGDLKKM